MNPEEAAQSYNLELEQQNDFLNEVVMTQKANLAVEQHIQERLRQRIRLAESLLSSAYSIVHNHTDAGNRLDLEIKHFLDRR